jgi:hypothetical protein
MHVRDHKILGESVENTIRDYSARSALWPETELDLVRKFRSPSAFPIPN